MAKCFMSWRVKIKPESEISSHISLTSVISGLFHTRYLHSNPIECRLHWRKVAVKTKKID